MGCVLIKGDGGTIYGKKIDDKTVQKIVELLGIPKSDRDKLRSNTKSVYIYHSPQKPSKGE
jgi:hypothetical protein